MGPTRSATSSSRPPSCARPKLSPERRGLAALRLAGLLAAVAACSGSTHAAPDGALKDAGADVAIVDPRAAICIDAGAPPSYDVIQKIFDAECLSCHTAGNDLVLAADVSWANLVGRPAPESCGGELVVPGDASSSYLYQKLTSAHPCSGTQMPAGEFGPVPLPACVVALVRDWILAGASGPTADAGSD